MLDAEKKPESGARGSRESLATRIACPSFLSSQPLIYGLDHDERVHILPDSHGQTWEMLSDGRADVALLPAIDLQRCPEPMTIVPAGCVSCFGPSFRSRIYSRVPPEDLRVFWADIESRTSTALAKALWACDYRRQIDVIPYDPLQQPLPEDAEAVLLIEDEVVCRPPLGFDRQIDLGSMWYQTAGLPFVFAVWTALDEERARAAYPILKHAREEGQKHLVEIAARYVSQYDWPKDLAERYLCRQLQYEFTDIHHEGLDEFFTLCETYEIIEEFRPVHYLQP